MSSDIGPARNMEAVTPSDSNELNGTSRGIYIGASGDVTVISVDGDTIKFKDAAQGSILPIYTNKVMSTGTTATDLVALY